MIVRAKAPLRLGFAGGGTDVSPYSDDFGGNVLNATIQMYAYCNIEPTNDNRVEFHANDIGRSYQSDTSMSLTFDGNLDLFKGIYNRIVRDHVGSPLSFIMTTYSDAMSESGLGGSSTMVVAALAAFREWLKIPLGDYDIAQHAYIIERKDVGEAGGKQDQYAATFGGFNFIEFYAGDKVIVNPLRIKDWIVNELEASLLLYYTGIKRKGGNIIEDQIRNAQKRETKSMESLHRMKQNAIKMKEALLFGDINKFAAILKEGWEAKKETAGSITNEHIDAIIESAHGVGAKAAKLSGAGGGGHILFVVDPKEKFRLRKHLESFGGVVKNVTFSNLGTQSWTV